MVWSSQTLAWLVICGLVYAGCRTFAFTSDAGMVGGEIFEVDVSKIRQTILQHNIQIHKSLEETFIYVKEGIELAYLLPSANLC